MGYTTEFTGRFKLTPHLNKAQVKYLQAFCESRRMKRDEQIVKQQPDSLRESVGLPVGTDGEFCVSNSDDNMCFLTREEMKKRSGVLDYNEPPGDQPGLWCLWVPTDDGRHLRWNGREKFYHYSEWLNYMVKSFFKLWGVRLDGYVTWKGQDRGDRGMIVADGEIISVLTGMTPKKLKESCQST